MGTRVEERLQEGQRSVCVADKGRGPTQQLWQDRRRLCVMLSGAALAGISVVVTGGGKSEYAQ